MTGSGSGSGIGSGSGSDAPYCFWTGALGGRLGREKSCFFSTTDGFSGSGITTGGGDWLFRWTVERRWFAPLPRRARIHPPTHRVSRTPVKPSTQIKPMRRVSYQF